MFVDGGASPAGTAALGDMVLLDEFGRYAGEFLSGLFTLISLPQPVITKAARARIKRQVFIRTRL
jgi:hypothetical protein